MKKNKQTLQKQIKQMQEQYRQIRMKELRNMRMMIDQKQQDGKDDDSYEQMKYQLAGQLLDKDNQFKNIIKHIEQNEHEHVHNNMDDDGYDGYKNDNDNDHVDNDDKINGKKSKQSNKSKNSNTNSDGSNKHKKISKKTKRKSFKEIQQMLNKQNKKTISQHTPQQPQPSHSLQPSSNPNTTNSPNSKDLPQPPKTLTPYTIFHIQKSSQLKSHKKFTAAKSKIMSRKLDHIKFKQTLTQSLQIYKKWLQLPLKYKYLYTQQCRQRQNKYNQLLQQYKVLSNPQSISCTNNSKPRILTSYNRYYKSLYEQLQSTSQQAYSLQQITQIIKDKWLSLTQQQKQPYQKQYQNQIYIYQCIQNNRQEYIKIYKQKIIQYIKEQDLERMKIQEKYQLTHKEIENIEDMVNRGLLERKYEEKLSNQVLDRQYQNRINNNLRRLDQIKAREISQLRQIRMKKNNIGKQTQKQVGKQKQTYGYKNVCTPFKATTKISDMTIQTKQPMQQESPVSFQSIQQQAKHQDKVSMNMNMKMNMKMDMNMTTPKTRNNKIKQIQQDNQIQRSMGTSMLKKNVFQTRK